MESTSLAEELFTSGEQKFRAARFYRWLETQSYENGDINSALSVSYGYMAQTLSDQLDARDIVLITPPVIPEENISTFLFDIETEIIGSPKPKLGDVLRFVENCTNASDPDLVKFWYENAVTAHEFGVLSLIAPVQGELSLTAPSGLSALETTYRYSRGFPIDQQSFQDRYLNQMMHGRIILSR